VHDACAFCETAIDPAERRGEWERLTPALREEFSKTFERALEARKAWREKLRKNRVRHTVAGACLNTVVIAFTHLPASEGFSLPYAALDAGLGALAGFALNHVRGGEYRGLTFFGAVYAFSAALKVATGELPLGLLFGLFVLFGFVGALGLGYLFGLNLSLRRSIED
jgi:hypothetical protein